MQLTLESSPYVMVQRSLVRVVTVLGLLALFATPVIGAEFDDPSPPSPQPGTPSARTRY